MNSTATVDTHRLDVARDLAASVSNLAAASVALAGGDAFHDELLDTLRGQLESAEAILHAIFRHEADRGRDDGRVDRRWAAVVAEVEAAFRPSDPNRAYHVKREIARRIAAAEREAYDVEDRRTIRPRYVAALDARRNHAIGSANDAHRAYMTARAALPVSERPRLDWTPETGDRSDLAELRRRALHRSAFADRVASTLARATSSSSTPERELIAAAERGEIDPAALLATVPDEFGRVSPFAVSGYLDGRSFTFGRNVSLSGALALARAHNAEPGSTRNSASVHFDSCG